MLGRRPRAAATARRNAPAAPHADDAPAFAASGPNASKGFEAGPGHQDVLPGVRHGGDGDVEGAGAAWAEDDVIRSDFRPRDANVVGDSLTSIHKPSAGAIAVPEAANERVSDRLHHFGSRVKVLVDCRIAEGQRYHLLFGVGGELHRLHDVSDRVEGVLSHDWGVDLPLRSDQVFVVKSIAIGDLLEDDGKSAPKKSDADWEKQTIFLPFKVGIRQNIQREENDSYKCLQNNYKQYSTQKLPFLGKI